MSTIRNASILSLSILAASAGAASADGFYASVAPGVAGAAAQTHVDGNSYTLKGAAGQLGLTLGWQITPRLAIDGELVGHAVVSPELDKSGMVHQTNDNVTWGIGYAGLGATAFFAYGVHVSGSAGVLRMTLDAPDMPTAKTNLGGGAKVGVGKDWQVAPHVGLGAALEVLGGAISDDKATWNVATVGLSLAATYR
jgi:hypothetical protein